ncbi:MULTISPECIES: transporter substrate-binding domain-containing protein [Brucella/Ochrobactrum group]|jgi:polar amino acid transport system substrate-binding protein|uniref:Transporter substrate-binding domain-containing protein n=1 Tax=Brucella pseudintermedia TaxID=370111 RepID=A0ABY5UCA9_9HYPH|nr:MULTISPECIES: transporter substrate-binding domain-containing protein [Brucella/Ochrobactrum group]KAB2681950.1 transporter substrate-binding domain-containing protein [Brucella pseudintermedia]MCO7725344.1 transporter substrate-binding domain-containing protein [Brucella intermedia]NKE75874.1 transporter substrate-binding domain-containing protein [Ochrobactrum sp. MC-1LL]UWL59997.1 transporter substrate-binding domain-containing protein [Brucella pseudintermedia]WPM80418.1 transporter sub
MKRHLPRLLIALASACGIHSAQASDTEPQAPSFINQKERLPLPSLQALTRLRFITTVDFPPFNMLGDQGQLSGYNVDLAKALCRQLGVDDICQIEAVPWNELEERLLGGQAEAILAGWKPTEANREQFAYSRSYMRLPARFATTIAGAFNDDPVTATKGKNVGVIAGTAHEQLLKSYFPQAVAKTYPDEALMLADLKSGKIGTVFHDGMSLSVWLNSPEGHACCTFAGGPYLAPQYLGSGLSIAVAQKNTPLVSAFDNALQALQQKGTLTELYLRYFPNSFY